MFSMLPIIKTNIETIEKKIHQFFAELKKRAETLKLFGLPTVLKNLITQNDLDIIYDFLTSPEIKFLIIDELHEQRACRIDKKESKLARTLNIILNEKTNDIQLILETKSKKINSIGKTEKTPIPIFMGSYKTTKPAWRIDTPEPMKMANSVLYAWSRSRWRLNLKNGITEGQIAQDIVQNLPEECTKVINVTTPGIPILTSHFQRRDETMIPYYAKQSHYSTYALGDLKKILANPIEYPFTKQDQDKMAESLLTAIQLLHDKNTIHQDIKLENILVFKNKHNQYYLSLTDYGITYHPTLNPKQEVLATILYESPEIVAVYSDKTKKHHTYFQNKAYSSYGRNIFEKQEQLTPLPATKQKTYNKPHKANDMWSIGMVLYQLYEKRPPTLSNDFTTIPFIAGLLHPDRDQRFTAKQALDALQKYTPTQPESSIKRVKLFTP